jgi:hypothetical protein
VTKVADLIVLEDELAAVATNQESSARDRLFQRSAVGADSQHRHSAQRELASRSRLQESPRCKLERTAAQGHSSAAQDVDRRSQKPLLGAETADGVSRQESRERSE